MVGRFNVLHGVLWELLEPLEHKENDQIPQDRPADIHLKNWGSRELDRPFVAVRMLGRRIPSNEIDAAYRG
jgi:hypothetical protein